MRDSDDAIDTLKLVNTELTARLTRQEASMSRVETKAVVVIGFAVTAAQFLATRNPFKSPLSILFGLLAFIAYAAAFGIGIWSTRVAKFADLDGAWLRSLAEQPQLDVLHKLIASRKHLVEKNKRFADRKGMAWWWSLAMLTAGLVSSIACIVQTA